MFEFWFVEVLVFSFDLKAVLTPGPAGLDGQSDALIGHQACPSPIDARRRATEVDPRVGDNL